VVNRLDEVKKVFFYGVILGITFIILGIVAMGFFIVKFGFTSLGWLFPVIAFLALGSYVLWQSIPAFIPIKKQKSDSIICPYCGAILKEDASVCEKCKQQITGN
jgi:hypothetical protein